MNKKLRERETIPLWIDHKDKIVSFKEVEGFEILYFSSREEKLAFALEKCASGYRIQ